MATKKISVVDWLDKFDESNYTLIFMESALRSMIQDGNIEESFVDDGISNVLRSVIEDYQYLLKVMKDFFQSSTISATLTIKDSIDKDGKDEKT